MKKKAHLLKKEFKKKEFEVLDKIKQETTHSVDIWAARSVAQVFDRIGVEYPRDTENRRTKLYTKLVSKL